MLTIKNNLPQVLHTSGYVAGVLTTLIIPANGSATCDTSTPLLDTHAKSRMVTISGTPTIAPVLPPTPAPTSTVTPTSDEPPTPPTTSGGKKRPA